MLLGGVVGRRGLVGLLVLAGPGLLLVLSRRVLLGGPGLLVVVGVGLVVRAELVW